MILTLPHSYVIERCESQTEGKYKEIYRCTSTEATIFDLRPVCPNPNPNPKPNPSPIPMSNPNLTRTPAHL